MDLTLNPDCEQVLVSKSKISQVNMTKSRRLGFLLCGT